MQLYAIIKSENNHWYEGLTSFGTIARGVRLLGTGSKFSIGQRVAVIQCGSEHGFTELDTYRSQLVVPDAQKKSVASEAPASVALARIAQLANNTKKVYQPVTIKERLDINRVLLDDNKIVKSNIPDFYSGARGLMWLERVNRIIGWWQCVKDSSGSETEGGYDFVDPSTFPTPPAHGLSITFDGKYWSGGNLGYQCLQGLTPETVTEPVFYHDPDNFGMFLPHRFSVYPDPDAKVVWISRYYFTATVFMALCSWSSEGEFIYEKTVSVSPSVPAVSAVIQTQPTTPEDPYFYSVAYFLNSSGVLVETKYIRWLKF